MTARRTRRRRGLLAAAGTASVAVLLAVTLGPVPGSAAPAATTGAVAAGERCIRVAPVGRPLRVVFVGDSMTQGLTGSATYRYWTWRGLRQAGVAARFVGPRQETNRLPAGETSGDGYEHVGHGFARNLSHAGRSRSTFARHPDTPDDLVRSFRPDLVVLQLGYNDANEPEAEAPVLVDRTQEFLRTVWAADLDLGRLRTPFVLGQIPQAGRSPQLPLAEKNARTRRANTLIRERLTEPCLVEVNDLRDARDPAWRPAVHTYDGTHPNPVGETLMAQRMLDAMRRLGLFRQPVTVYRRAEAWTPRPALQVRRLGGDRYRFVWRSAKARVGADRMHLVIQRPGARPVATAWSERDSATRTLRPGTVVRVVAGRGRSPGLPTVSSPGPPVTVPRAAR